jgi:hypothetical protein
MKPTVDTKWSATGTKTEPSSGQKDAGWTAGGYGFAQWMNFWQDGVDQWVKWLAAFESTAHTWSAQQTFNAGPAVTPLIGDGSVGGGNANGVQGIAGGSGAGVLGQNTGGTGPGVDGIAANTATSTGVRGRAFPGQPGYGVTGWGNGSAGTGAGVAGFGNASSTVPAAGGDGVLGTASTSANMAGVRGKATAVGNESGVTGDAGTFGLVPGVLGKAGTGAGSFGVQGVTGGVGNFAAVYGLSSHAGAYGVYGAASTGAESGVYGTTGGTSNGAGVSGVSAHDGVPGVKGFAHGSTGEAGVHGSGLGASGYGVIAEGKNSSPVRSALRIVPQSVAPTSPQRGDVYVDGTGVMWIYNGSAWHFVNVT